MHTRIRTRLMTIATAIALLATACGGGDTTDTTQAIAADTTTAPTTAAPTTTAAPATTTAAPTTTATPTTTPAPTTTTAPPTTTTTTTMPPNLLIYAGIDEPGPSAPAGEYHTRVLSHTLHHTFDAEVSVWQADSKTYVIGEPGFNVGSYAIIAFLDASAVPAAETLGIHNAPEDAPNLPLWSAGDLDAFFAESPGLLLLDSGTHSDDHSLNHWWEFTVDADTAEGYDHCNFGDHCLNILWVDACDCYFIAGEEWTFRIWRLSHGDGAVYAWFQAPNDIYADHIDWGAAIAGATTVHH